MKFIGILFFLYGFYHTLCAGDSCIFKHSTRGVIDLTSLGLRNGKPRFQDITPSAGSSYSYSFNPCYSFSEKSCGNGNVAVCQISLDQSYSFTLGVQTNSNWTIHTDNTVTLLYTYNTKSVSIQMVCVNDGPDSLIALGENPINHYRLLLQSRCACWNGCLSPQSSTKPTPITTRSPILKACVYDDSRYGTIDLSSIGSVNGDPTFKDLKSIVPDKYLWSYNPCYQFSEANCNNVAGCLIDQSVGISYPIGYQEYAYWTNISNTIGSTASIIYPSPSLNRRLNVELICDRSSVSHRLQILGETSFGEYGMKLIGPCACWNGCTKPPSFKWNVVIIVSAVGAVIFLLFIILISCCFCSKPKQYQSIVFIDEGTPIMQN